MALTGGTLWEIRSGGADTNGTGFYNRDPGTSIDYTKQDAAQASFTNLTTAGAGATTLTDGDAGGLFTAAMAGNIIYIASGTNFSAGYYEVVTFTNGDNVILDRSPTPGAAGSSGNGKVGGGRVSITDAFLEGVTAGDTIWLEAGTYALAANLLVAKAGTQTAPITFEGYYSSRGDAPTGNNRPLIQAGTWTFYLQGNHWKLSSIRFTISQAGGVYLSGTYSAGYNLACIQSTNSVTAKCYYLGTGCQLINCEGSSTITKGYGVEMVGQGSKVMSCYFHDLEVGIYTSGGNAQAILFNVVEDCTIYGIRASVSYVWIWCNTSDGNAIGIYTMGAFPISVRHNSISNNTTGASASVSCLINDWDHNNWYGNTADTNNVTKGPNATAVDPKYTNAGGDDYSLQSDSAMREAAVVISLGVG